MKLRIRLLVIICLLGAFVFMACRNGEDPDVSPSETADVTTPGEDRTTADEAHASETTLPDDSSGSPTEPPEEKSAVTLMIYMTGSDLESSSAAATKDLAEMLESGLDFTKVNVVIFTGGSKNWFVEIPTEENALLKLTPEGIQTEETFDLLSMGDPENLTRFLNYAEEHYKAERYDLILWDHGNGPLIGYGKDKLHDNDSMTLAELGEALRNSAFGPENKLGFIGFDACLMASAELVCVTGDYADYLISSQETEPNFGWNYACLEGLDTLPTRDFARQTVEKYIEYCEDYFKEKEFFRSDVTLSVVDLSCAEALRSALNDLFAEAAEDVSGDYNKLAVSRIRARALGRASTGSEYDLVDLESLMESMSGRYAEKTAAVREILESAVLLSGTNAPECCGLSIYYPYYNKNYYNRSWKEVYNDLGLFPDYLTYLERYEKVWLGTDLKELFEGELVPENGKEASTYTLRLTEEQAEAYAGGQYYILRRMGEGRYTLVYVSDEVDEEEGKLTARFDGRVIYFENDQKIKNIPLSRCIEAVGSTSEYTVLFAGLERGSFLSDDWERLYIQYHLSLDHETGSLEVKDVYGTDQKEEEMSTGKREEIDFSRWDTFIFVDLTSRYLRRNDSGSIMSYWDWPAASEIYWYELPIADGLHFTYQPLYDDGNEYFLMFEVRDVQGGSYSSELLPITLEKAPEDSVETTEYEWHGEESLTVYEGEGVSAELGFYKDEEGGDMLCKIRVRNNNSFPVSFQCAGIVFDEKVRANQAIGETIRAGETSEGGIPDFEAICHYRNESMPGSMSFNLHVKNGDTGGTMIKNQVIKVVFPEGEEALISGLPAGTADSYYHDLPDLNKIELLPFHGAFAGEQILVDNELVRIRLIGAGRRSDSLYSEKLAAVIEVENKTFEEIPVGVYGLDLNGLYKDDFSQTGILPGRSVRYLSVEYRDSSLSDEPPIGSVGRLSLLILTNWADNTGTKAAPFGGNWYPVRLTESSDQEYTLEHGAPIYDEKDIRIELRSIEESFSSYGEIGKKDYAWYLTITNGTKQNIEIDLVDCMVDGEKIGNLDMLLSEDRVGAGTSVYSRISQRNRDAQKIPVISFRLRFLSMGSGEILYESDEAVEIRPEMVPEKEYETVLWEGEPSILLAEEEGIRAELQFFRSSRDGNLMAALQVTNSNDAEITFACKEIVIDGKVLVDRDLELKVPAKEQKSEWFSNLSVICHYRGAARPESLSFVMEAVGINHSLPVYGEAVMIDLSQAQASALEALPAKKAGSDSYYMVDVTPGVRLKPFRGACAEEQVLRDDEQVRLRLVALGKNPNSSMGNDSMSIVLEVWNKTDGLIPVTIEGVSADGAYESSQISNVHDELPGGMIRYFSVSYDFYKYTGLSGIHELSLLILTDPEEAVSIDFSTFRGGTWYPVALAESADKAYEPEFGELVYDEGGVKIGFMSMEEQSLWSGEKTAYNWNLMVRNETGKHIEIEIDQISIDGKPANKADYSNGPALYRGEVAAGCYNCAYISLEQNSASPKPGTISFNVRIINMGSYDEAPLYSSETVVELTH